MDIDTELIRLQSKLRLMAFKYVSNECDANDLLQETNVRVLENTEKYVHGTNFIGWCTVIMRNVYINMFNRRNSERTDFIGVAGDYGLCELSGMNADSLSVVSEIKSAIQSLPVIEKHCLCMYMNGYKYIEIADIIGVPIGTVKSAIFRARERLKHWR